MPTSTVELDQFQYLSDLNPHFRRIKAALRDVHVWDKSRIAEALTTVPVEFKGTTTPGLTIVVKHTFINPKNFLETISEQRVVADDKGRFTISFVVQRGENHVIAEAEFDSSIKSNIVRVNFYNWAVFVRAYVEEFFDLDAEQKVIFLDSFIGSARDSALRDNFGVFTRLKRPTLFTRAQYRKIIEDVLSAYRISTSEEAINIVARAFTGQTPRFRNTRIAYSGNRAFRLGTELKLKAQSLVYDIADRLIYFFDGGPVHVNRCNFNIPSQIRIAPDNQQTWVFVDSDGVIKESAIQIFNSATQFVLGVITTKDGMVTDITECSRLDDDAFYLDQGFLEMSMEIFILNSGILSGLQKNALLDELEAVKPAHVAFHISFSDGTQGVII